MSNRYALEDIEGFDEDSSLVQVINLKNEVSQTGDYDKLHALTETIEEESNGTEAPSSDSTESEPVESSTDDTETLDATEPSEDETKKESSDKETEKPDTSGKKDDSEDKSDEDDESDKDKDKDESELKETNGKKQSIATESLRDEYYDRIVLEGIGDLLGDGAMALKAGTLAVSGAMVSGAIAGGVYAASFLKEAATVLFNFGIKYTPVAFAHAKKATIYLFFKSAKLVLKSIASVSNFTKRYRRSLSRKRKEIVQLREKLTKLEFDSGKLTKLTPIQKVSLDRKMVAWLTVNQKTDTKLSAETMLRFLTSIVGEVDRRTIFDIEAVGKLIELSSGNRNLDPTMVLSVPPFQAGFLKKRVEGHLKDPELIDPYVYGTTLPDSTILVANIPRKDLKDIDTISRAYTESSMFLTADNRHPPTSQTVDYMDLQGLIQFLDLLDKLCGVAESHLSFYATVEKSTNKLKLGYKHYYQKLTSPEGEKWYEMLSEYVYLKQGFVNRVYLPASMDIHDYVCSYLTATLKFVRENIKLLEPKSTV